MPFGNPHRSSSLHKPQSAHLLAALFLPSFLAPLLHSRSLAFSHRFFLGKWQHKNSCVSLPLLLPTTTTTSTMMIYSLEFCICQTCQATGPGERLWISCGFKPGNHIWLKLRSWGNSMACCNSHCHLRFASAWSRVSCGLTAENYTKQKSAILKSI